MPLYWYLLPLFVFSACISKRLDFIKNPQDISILEVDDITTWKYDSKFEKYDLVVEKSCLNITAQGLLVKNPLSVIYMPKNLTDASIKCVLNIPSTNIITQLFSTLTVLDKSINTYIFHGLISKEKFSVLISEYNQDDKERYSLIPPNLEYYLPSTPTQITFSTGFTKRSLDLKYNNLLIGEMKEGVEYKGYDNHSHTNYYENHGFMYGIRASSLYSNNTGILIESIDIKCFDTNPNLNSARSTAVSLFWISMVFYVMI